MRNLWISILVCGMFVFSGCKQEETVVIEEKEKEEEQVQDIEIVDFSSACLNEDKDSVWFLVELKNPNGMYEFDSSKVILTLYDKDDNEVGSVVDVLENVTPNETVHWMTRAESDNGEVVDHFHFGVESHKHKAKSSSHSSYVENVSVTDVEVSDGVVSALLKNESEYEFDSVDVIFSFYDKGGKVVYADQVTLLNGQENIELSLPEHMSEYDHFETFVHGTLSK